MNALLAGAAPVQSAPAVAAATQMVAQPAEQPPEPVTDLNNVWVAAMNRRPCDDPPYTEAEKQWLRELTGREPRSNTTRLGSQSSSRLLL